MKVGAAVDDETSIAQGLAAGEKVIYEGQDSVSDGAEVTVVSEVAK